MRRFAIGLFAALLGVGSMAPLAEAQRPWDRDRDYRERDDDRDGSRRWGRNRSGRSRYSQRLMSDPVYAAWQNSREIRVNNFFDGGRYHTSGQRFSPDILRIEDVRSDGTYEVWFNGNYYPAYARNYRGTTLLYVGSAPSRQGYLYELIVQ